MSQRSEKRYHKSHKKSSKMIKLATVFQIGIVISISTTMNKKEKKHHDWLNFIRNEFVGPRLPDNSVTISRKYDVRNLRKKSEDRTLFKENFVGPPIDNRDYYQTKKYFKENFVGPKKPVRRKYKDFTSEEKADQIMRVNKRFARLKNATPAWADMKKIKEFYVEAQTLTRSTGIVHEVDHIVPIQGRLVCGLHVENNLRVLTRDDNRAKLNHHLIE